MKMIRIKNHILLVLALGALTACSSSTSKDAAAAEKLESYISEIKGDAFGIIDGEEVKLKKDMVIKKGDQIKTRLNAFVDLDLGERGVLRIRPKTDFTLQAIEKENIEINIKKGKVLSCLRKLKKQEQFKVQTPTIIAAVRGTSFLIDASDRSSKVAVLTGKVKVQKGSESVTISEMKEVAIKDSIQKERVIRGTSLVGVKEMVNITSVEKTGELDLMKLNLSKLQIIDQKNIKDDIEINEILEASSIDFESADRRENLKDSQDNIQLKKKKLNNDEDLELKK